MLALGMGAPRPMVNPKLVDVETDKLTGFAGAWFTAKGPSCKFLIFACKLPDYLGWSSDFVGGPGQPKYGWSVSPKVKY